MNQTFSIAVVAVLAGVGLGLSILGHRRGTPANWSPLRCLAGMVGGVAFLVQITWLDAWTAVIVSGVLTLLVTIVRIGRRRGEPSSSHPVQSWAEVTYAVAGTGSLAIAWGMMGNRWLAFVPISFMAWGDNTAGITRATIWRHQPASRCPSLCMLGVCLCSSLLFHPWWIGATAGLAATLTERYRPRLIGWLDDNPIIVAVSLALMTAILKLSARA